MCIKKIFFENASMSRKIKDYPVAFADWNFINSFRSVINVTF